MLGRHDLGPAREVSAFVGQRSELPLSHTVTSGTTSSQGGAGRLAPARFLWRNPVDLRPAVIQGFSPTSSIPYQGMASAL